MFGWRLLESSETFVVNTGLRQGDGLSDELLAVA